MLLTDGRRKILHLQQRESRRGVVLAAATANCLVSADGPTADSVVSWLSASYKPSKLDSKFALYTWGNFLYQSTLDSKFALY